MVEETLKRLASMTMNWHEYTYYIVAHGVQVAK